jgi:AraC family transcriptional regulator
MTSSPVELVRDGARATCAVVGPFEIQLLTFAPQHSIEPVEFERGYVVAVLEGAVAKTFVRARWSLERDSLATLPAGASHLSRFGRAPTRVLAIRGSNGEARELDPVLRRLRHVRAAAATAIACRLAGELRAADESWALAAEGLALQLLAAASRADPPVATRRARWLRDVRDLLHDRAPSSASLSELAEEVGVDRSHLARSFRLEYGLTVGEYARALRLDWAASQLALGEPTLAEIAAEAGFADQSHFTRAFRGWAGTTPGRYRELLRR